MVELCVKHGALKPCPQCVVTDGSGHWHECLDCQRRIACYLRHESDYSYFVKARQCVHCQQEQKEG